MEKTPDPPFAIPEDGDFSKGFLKLTENTLVGAAREGDLEAIKEHIAEGADVNALYFEMPPLAWATIMGQTEAIELLLQHGADINGRNRDGNTALHLAAFLGHTKAAELLLKRGADVNAKNGDGGTPADMLHVDWETTAFIGRFIGIEIEEQEIETIKAGRSKIAKLFGVAGTLGDIDTFSPQRVSGAAFIGDFETMEQALIGGADPNMKDPQSGSTLLATAALMGHTKVVALLLEHGADVNVRSKDGGTALHAAAFLGRAETVKLLLDKGADTTLRNNMGGIAMEGAKLNWLITKGILAMLKLEVDEAEVKAGRVKVVELLSRHNKNQ